MIDPTLAQRVLDAVEAAQSDEEPPAWVGGDPVLSAALNSDGGVFVADPRLAAALAASYEPPAGPLIESVEVPDPPMDDERPEFGPSGSGAAEASEAADREWRARSEHWQPGVNAGREGGVIV